VLAGTQDVGGREGRRKDPHVHDQNARFVKLVDDFVRGYTDGRNEETGLFLNDNVDELWQLAACVIKLAKNTSLFIAECRQVGWQPRTFVLRALPPICGRSRSTPNGALGSFKYFFSSLI